MNDFHLAVTGNTGTCRNQLADDDVFLETNERIGLALDSCIGEDSGGFLEGSCREEGIGGQSGLSGAEEEVFAGCESLSARNTTISTVSPGSQLESPGS